MTQISSDHISLLTEKNVEVVTPHPDVALKREQQFSTDPTVKLKKPLKIPMPWDLLT